MKEGGKKFFVVLFILIILLPMFLKCMERTFNIKEIPLNNVELFEKPDFSMSSFFTGEFQKDYENWFCNNFGGKNIFTRTYNQFRFSLFHISASSSGVRGNNKDLFQQEYIDEFFGLSSKYDYSVCSNRVQLEVYVDKLEYITRKLEEQGKIVIFLTTPNKCDFNNKDIPYIYKIAASGNYIRGIDYLRTLLLDRDIHYLDGYQIIMDSIVEYPVFYNSGIHWSRPVEQQVSAKILEKAANLLKMNIKSIELKEVEISDTPFWRDCDIWNLFNIWENPQNEYYQYRTETFIPKQYVNLNILIQGGSFAQGCREDFIQNNIADNVNYIFYNQYILTKDGQVIEISNLNQTDSMYSDWSRLNLEDLLNEANVIIIETNEKHIFAYNNGFVDLLYEYLLKTETDDR